MTYLNGEDAYWSYVTEEILLYGGGKPAGTSDDVSTVNPYGEKAVLEDGTTDGYRKPPTVKNLRECYNDMMSKPEWQYFGLYGPPLYDLSDDTIWELFADLETEYSCAGICHKPLFYVTKDIDQGPPERECLLPLVDDILNSSKNILNGMGAFLLLSALL